MRRAEQRARRSRNEERCERILATSRPLETDDLDWEAIPATDLDEGTLACLVYMRDVEGFTDRDLVGLAGHPTTLADPIVHRFLDVWRSEESVHARLLDRFLTTYGHARGLDLPTRQLPPDAAPPVSERVLVRVTRPMGHVITAAHMAWGAANELLTLNGYRILARRSGHPVLSDLLARIADQEARHYSFYLLQAEWRLGASLAAQRLLSRILRRTWTPVGIGDEYKQPAEFDRVLAHLTEGEDADRTVARMDRRFAALPGFGELRIYRDAVARSRAARTAA